MKVAPAYQAPVAVSPRLPNTGTGGLLDASDQGVTATPFLAGALGLLGVVGATLLRRRRSS